MSKAFITPSYTFTPGASGVGTVNLSGITSFDVKKLVAVINQTRGVVIYSTASTSAKFTAVSGTTVTLNYDTSTHASGDRLQVIYDEGAPASESQLIANGVLMGAVTETAPASDAASSGLNGRLQRIAQRITSLIALLPASLGQKTMSGSLSVTVASDQSLISVNDSTSVSGTITSTQKTVGTSAVRATVSGSAPSATRKKLILKPSKNNTGAIYIGPSSITTANAMEIIGPDRVMFEYDSSDYYLISDTASQVVEIIEVA
jgi:hypothetical protein